MSYTLFKSKNGAVLEYEDNQDTRNNEHLRYSLNLTTTDGRKIGMWLLPKHNITNNIQSLITLIDSKNPTPEIILAQITVLASLVENGGFTSLEIAHHMTDMLHNDLPTAQKLLTRLEELKNEWLSKPIDEQPEFLEPVTPPESVESPEVLRRPLPVNVPNIRPEFEPQRRFTKVEQCEVISFIDTLISVLRSLLNLPQAESKTASPF